MTFLRHRKREAYAQALAVDLSPREAAKAAGYAEPRNKTGLAKARDIVDREAEIRRARAGGGSRDLGGLIDELMATAAEARRLKDPRGIATTKGLYELVGKLKDKLPDPAGTLSPRTPPPRSPPATPPTPPAPAVVLQPWDADLSQEEWLARYGPDAPGGKPGSP